VFTARYALSSCIKQIRFVFKGIILQVLFVLKFAFAAYNLLIVVLLGLSDPYSF
jgi:hypothetical protein